MKKNKLPLHILMFVIGAVIPLLGPIGLMNYLKYESDLSDENINFIGFSLLFLQGIIVGSYFKI